MRERQKRRYAAGTRIRFDAPGWWFHGKTGTVAQDMLNADAVVFSLPDGKPRDRDHIIATVSFEVARLRDQTPNTEHGSTFPDHWWLLEDAA